MIKKLTKKQRAALAPYERNMHTALYSNFTRAMSVRAIDTVKEVYEQIIGRPYKMNYNCSSCLIDLMKRVGKYYFESENN